MSADAVVELLARYGEAWRSNRAERLAEHWDGDRFVLYKAEEVPEFFLSFDDVTGYWRHNERFNARVELGFGVLAARPLAGPYALATVAMRWDIEFRENASYLDGRPFPYGGQCMGGDNQVLLLTTGSGADLRLAGWSETPDAPLAYMARLYRSNVLPDFVNDDEAAS